MGKPTWDENFDTALRFIEGMNSGDRDAMLVNYITNHMDRDWAVGYVITESVRRHKQARERIKNA